MQVSQERGLTGAKPCYPPEAFRIIQLLQHAGRSSRVLEGHGVGLTSAMGYSTAKGFKRAASVLAGFFLQSSAGLVQVFLGFLFNFVPVTVLRLPCKHSNQAALSIDNEYSRTRTCGLKKCGCHGTVLLTSHPSLVS